MRVFGGFASISWSKENDKVSDPEAFLFSLDDWKVYEYGGGPYSSQYHEGSEGPSFSDLVFQGRFD